MENRFLLIAKTAEVPLVLITFDYGKKEIKISEPHWPTDNMQQDFKTLKPFLKSLRQEPRSEFHC